MRRAVLASALVAGVVTGLGAAGILADSVTMQASETVLRTGVFSVGVSGRISSGAEGEYVAVMGKECGIPGAFFRGIGGGTTTAGGHYEAAPFIRTRTTLRAKWKDAVSPTVVVTPRALVTLTREPDGFRVGLALDVASTDGKRARIERLTPSGWKLVQTVALSTEGYNGYAEKDKLRFKVPKGTTIRAVIPRSQVAPCYLAGYSKLVRT
jgi:hypothetical protein